MDSHILLRVSEIPTLSVLCEGEGPLLSLVIFRGPQNLFQRVGAFSRSFYLAIIEAHTNLDEIRVIRAFSWPKIFVRVGLPHPQKTRVRDLEKATPQSDT
jgi:hypothetical protein